MKIGLHTISYAGLFYDGPGLTLEEQIERAAAYGFESVEVMAKRPVASPFEMDADRCARCRDLAAEKGLSMDFIAGYVDLGRPDPVDRERELVWAKETFRMTRDLGGKYCRVYAGGERIYDDAPVWDQWDWCIEGLKTLVPVAKDFGVQMALEIHTGTAQTVAAMVDMLQEIDDPSVVVVLDPPLLALHNEDVTEAYQTIRPLADIVHAHICDHVHRPAWITYHSMVGLGAQHTDYIYTVPIGEGVVDIIGFMRVAHADGFDGSLAVEVCTPFHFNHKRPTIEDVDRIVTEGVKWLKAKRAEIVGS